jgi:2-polyprenyl-3-methyl-5-hydroxy-6-metoxy-1,4-benzoquinol methylase
MKKISEPSDFMPPSTASSSEETSLRDRFSAWAQSYDDRTANFRWIAPQFLLEAVMRYAPPTALMRVLDVGVGTGKASIPYLEAGARVTGLDLSSQMLRQAQANYPQFQALLEHNFDRPFAEVGLQDQQFEVILSCGALHFAKNLAQTLAELRAMLTPDGVLAFTYISPQSRSFSTATQPRNPDAVEQMLQQMNLIVLDHQSFVAYYEGGDSTDPVIYQRIVACCSESRERSCNPVPREV